MPADPLFLTRTAPLPAAEFLTLMSTEVPGLYVLGSLNRHVTVHSQQRRAINLIHVLRQADGKTDGTALDGKAVTIVGAGFAGLTAAAYALEKTTATITLCETAPRPLWIQDDCQNRWLHPGIYDWPLPGSLEPCTDLPVLNWRAAAACDVAEQVRVQWDRIAATQGRVQVKLETKVSEVAPLGRDGKLLVRAKARATDLQWPADIVVMAVGFGLEPGDRARIGYWNDVDGLDGIRKGASVLVSGFGDGGLADVLRLCLPTIRQEGLMELVKDVPLDVRKDLVLWEDALQGNPDALDGPYRALSVPAVIESLSAAPAPPFRVTLAGRGSLYGSRSAILNRFLVSQLRQARGADAFELVTAPVDESSLTVHPGGKHSIMMEGEASPRQFDHTVLRLGPVPAYRQVPPLDSWKVGLERRASWYRTPQALDRTRVPLWPVDRPIEPDQRGLDFLAYESSSRRWCLVLEPPNAKIKDWAALAGKALRAADDGGSLNTVPLVLRSDEAVKDPAALRSAVRGLCAADIVVADITGYDPGLMVLLGIRAAVRRSITIACTKASLGTKTWAEVPFNLRELNPISFANEAIGREQLAQMLRAGIQQASTAAGYLDLPVYDYVRDDPPAHAAGIARRVLFLRAFGKYTTGREGHVQDGIRQGLGLPPETPVDAVIDEKSPRLAGQRLYEAIRHWQDCVVDLTFWRPNVLFELGVRLAVHGGNTTCLIDKELQGEETWAGTRAMLRDLVKPFVYSLSTQTFKAAFTTPRPEQRLIYETVARHFRTEQDRGARVDAMLVPAPAGISAKRDPLEAVDLTVLYARDNLAYASEVRQAAFERLCAAWHYLADREQAHTVRPIDLLHRRRAADFHRMRYLGSSLKNVLAHRYEARDRRLLDRIAESEAIMDRSGANRMAELLAEAQILRSRPPWTEDLQERGDLVDDYRYTQGQLEELKTALEELASPVCILPLQGLQNDLERLQAVIESISTPRRTS